MSLSAPHTDGWRRGTEVLKVKEVLVLIEVCPAGGASVCVHNDFEKIGGGGAG